MAHSREDLARFFRACPQGLAAEAWQRASDENLIREQAPLPFYTDPSGPLFREDTRTGQITALRPFTRADLDAYHEYLLEEAFHRSDYLSTPAATRAYIRRRLALCDREMFAGIFLDNRQGVLRYQELYFGTVDQCTVHLRGVVLAALNYNAKSMIAVHNHPSGDPEPSRSDERLTHRLKEALGLVEVNLLDHLIVAGPQIVSLAERGLV